MDLSLEEIIKMKKVGRSRPNAPKKRLQNNKQPNKKAGGLGGRIDGRDSKPARQPSQGRGKIKSAGKPLDARMKIIQKNRQRMTDARDKLAEIAKQTDARTKIKGRKTNNQNGRQDARGRVGFRTNQNMVAISRQPPVLLQRSIKNNVAANLRDPSSMIRCTINRAATDFPRSFEEDMDIDDPLPIRSHNNLMGIQVALQNKYSHYIPPQKYVPSREPYMDSYKPPAYRSMDSLRSAQRSGEPRRMSLEMRARLDTPARPTRPPSPSPPPSQPQGHRIVVSNLQSSVTHEDIKELFEDIGPLLTSRLVRAGTAEVIYEFQKDAKMAVDAYHNRQLDGQPMKCLLVNSRPTTSSSSGVLRSNNAPAPPKFPSSSKSMVVPDLSAIHKALFTPK